MGNLIPLKLESLHDAWKADHLVERASERADLNMHVSLSAIYYAYCSFTVWVLAAFISRQSALIV